MSQIERDAAQCFGGIKGYEFCAAGAIRGAARGGCCARGRSFNSIALTTFRDITWSMPYCEALGYPVFVPGPDHTGMAEIIDDELSYGYCANPRGGDAQTASG